MIKRGLLLALALSGFSLAGAATLDTPNYTIQVDSHCKEGNVTCDNVTYTELAKKSGATLTLTGKTLFSLCADGKTPCRFLGYQFNHGDYQYTLLEVGLMRVTQGQEHKVVVEERGKWSH